MAIPWTVAARCPLPTAPPADRLASWTASRLPVALPARRRARVGVAELSAGGEQPRPLDGGLGDRPPRPRRRAGEAHERDDADGLAVELAPARDVAREAVAQARLAGRPEPEERDLAPRNTGGAATFAPQVALIPAPLTVSKVWLRTGWSSCTVSTRPSRLKRTPRSTSVATTFLPGGAAGRSTSDSRATVTTTATRASDGGERHQRLRQAQPAERRAQPAERRTAFAPVFDRRHAFELGAQPVQVPRLPMTRHIRFSHCRRRPARPRLTR